MENFNRYFLHQRTVFLENISYETPEKPLIPRENYKLGCKDILVAQLLQNGIKVSFNRALNFEGGGPYSLSVTFSCIMPFDPSTKDEVDWKNTDIAGEFRKNCPDVMANLMSRTSLLISQITSSYGQPPLITPAAPKK